MRINTLNFLQCKLNIKSTLLVFITAIFLSACGIKGKLYETPESVETPQEKSTTSSEASEVSVTPNSQVLPTKTSTVEQGKEQQ